MEESRPYSQINAFIYNIIRISIVSRDNIQFKIIIIIIKVFLPQLFFDNKKNIILNKMEKLYIQHYCFQNACNCHDIGFVILKQSTISRFTHGHKHMPFSSRHTQLPKENQQYHPLVHHRPITSPIRFSDCQAPPPPPHI